MRERFAWKLAAAPDEKVAAKLLKDVRKPRGVAEASSEGDALLVQVALEDLTTCGVAGTIPAGPDGESELDPAGLGAPRACFDSGALWDLLASAGLSAGD